MAVPNAPVFDIQKTKTTNMLYVMCPFCNHTHKHGDPDIVGKTSFGTRLSHCLKNKKTYNLVLRYPTKTEVRPSLVIRHTEGATITFS